MTNKINPRQGKPKLHAPQMDGGPEQSPLKFHPGNTVKQVFATTTGGMGHATPGSRVPGQNPLSKPTPEKKIQTGVTITPGMNRSRSVAAKSDDEHAALGLAILQDAADAFRCK